MNVLNRGSKKIRYDGIADKEYTTENAIELSWPSMILESQVIIFFDRQW